MKERLTKKENVLIATMLFGLFFGAGNLIFPAYMGQLAGKNMWQAIVGFVITGVGLPLLGRQYESAFAPCRELKKPIGHSSLLPTNDYFKPNALLYQSYQAGWEISPQSGHPTQPIGFDAL